jgi:hypothetical protein
MLAHATTIYDTVDVDLHRLHPKTASIALLGAGIAGLGYIRQREPRTP